MSDEERIKKAIEKLEIPNVKMTSAKGKSFKVRDIFFCIKMFLMEVYIKITMGIVNENAICISFHLSEFPMTCPFKKK